MSHLCKMPLTQCDNSPLCPPLYALQFCHKAKSKMLSAVYLLFPAYNAISPNIEKASCFAFLVLAYLYVLLRCGLATLHQQELPAGESLLLDVRVGWRVLCVVDVCLIRPLIDINLSFPFCSVNHHNEREKMRNFSATRKG